MSEVLAIIPAEAGRRASHKNIQAAFRHPLIAYSIAAGEPRNVSRD
jgi:CMP-N-acetylneuraminic acid synthetase